MKYKLDNQLKIPALSLLAGLMLVPLLPIGLVSVRGFSFQMLWAIHLFLQLTAVVFCAGRLKIIFKEAKFLKLYFLISTCAVLAFICLQGLLPITEKDALIYHLQVPKLWLEHGNIYKIDWLEWSFFPMLLGLAYTGFLQNGLEALTPFYHLSFLLILSVLIAEFVWQKIKEPELGLVAFLLCLSFPICIKLGFSPLADFGLSLYFGVAVYSFYYWLADKKKIFPILLCGLGLGLSLSNKYNSILVVLIFYISILVFLVRDKESFREVFRFSLISALIALLIFLPWPVRNFIWTGNPVYPFLSRIFGGIKEATPFMGSFGAIEYRLLAYGESFFDILLLPLKMIFVGKDGSQRYFDGVLSPILLIGAVPLFSSWRKKAWVSFGYLYAFGYFLVSITLFYALLRYQLPLTLMAISLVCLGLFSLTEINKNFKKVIYYFLISGHLIWVGFYCHGVLKKDQTVKYFKTNQTKDEYLRQQLDFYAGAEYVNSNLNKSDGVYLLMTGNRYYYFDVPVRGGYFSGAPLGEVLNAKDGDTELVKVLKSWGINYIFANIGRTANFLNENLDENGKKSWEKLANSSLKIVYKDKHHIIWKLGNW